MSFISNMSTPGERAATERAEALLARLTEDPPNAVSYGRTIHMRVVLRFGSFTFAQRHPYDPTGGGGWFLDTHADNGESLYTVQWPSTAEVPRAFYAAWCARWEATWVAKFFDPLAPAEAEQPAQIARGPVLQLVRGPSEPGTGEAE